MSIKSHREKRAIPLGLEAVLAPALRCPGEAGPGPRGGAGPFRLHPRLGPADCELSQLSSEVDSRGPPAPLCPHSLSYWHSDLRWPRSHGDPSGGLPWPPGAEQGVTVCDGLWTLPAAQQKARAGYARESPSRPPPSSDWSPAAEGGLESGSGASGDPSPRPSLLGSVAVCRGGSHTLSEPWLHLLGLLEGPRRRSCRVCQCAWLCSSAGGSWAGHPGPGGHVIKAPFQPSGAEPRGGRKRVGLRSPLALGLPSAALTTQHRGLRLPVEFAGRVTHDANRRLWSEAMVK